MFDLRPVGYVIGLLVAMLGVSMLLPLAADMIEQRGETPTFAVTTLLTILSGSLMMLSCAQQRKPGLSLKQTFLMTTMTWLVLPAFGALPFWIGEPNATITDAFFEAMSGLTTTGATVFEELEQLPAGTLLWRSMLQWFGGIGIIVVALAFLPSLGIGGMQIFKSEAFDTFGKILPRAAQIASSITWIYLVITLACLISYAWAGMSGFEALNHAMTTVATGGFSTHDDSIGHFGPQVEYVATVFMILASLPFVRFIQMTAGNGRALFGDSQVRSYASLIVVTVMALSLWVTFQHGQNFSDSFRESLFNAVSILSGTGYASTDYQAWGAFAIAVFFLIGLIGGCAGSTACSVKIFRYELLFSVLLAQIRRIHSPSGIVKARYDGKPITDEVVSSVMAFFVMFFLTLAVVAVILSFVGLDPVTAISGASAALANIGPGLGDRIGPAGNYAGLPETAKWVLAMAMLIGRLEVMSVYVLFTVTFWRR